MKLDPLPRTTVRQVACPECEASPGEQCMGVGGPRVSNHLARVAEAWAYLERPKPKPRRAVRRIPPPAV